MNDVVLYFFMTHFNIIHRLKLMSHGAIYGLVFTFEFQKAFFFAVISPFLMSGLIRLSHYTYVAICLINIRLASTAVTVSTVQPSHLRPAAVL
jgi:hypothetical protein